MVAPADRGVHAERERVRGDWIEEQGIPGIYRIHEMPDPKRIVEFEETASGFGYSLGSATCR